MERTGRSTTRIVFRGLSDGMRCSWRDYFATLLRGKPELGSTAEQLLGDEILGLAARINPDGPDVNPAWLSGPGPINYWRTHFARTLVDPRDQGRVHIMVVNADEAQVSTANAGAIGGSHWFVAAWFVEPAAHNA